MESLLFQICLPQASLCLQEEKTKKPKKNKPKNKRHENFSVSQILLQKGATTNTRYMDMISAKTGK
jgi:hypothetical protein